MVFLNDRWERSSVEKLTVSVTRSAVCKVLESTGGFHTLRLYLRLHCQHGTLKSRSAKHTTTVPNSFSPSCLHWAHQDRGPTLDIGSVDGRSP
ncbi:hypothetical protein AAFF_G00278160 [Aldrovandia affinis]|uniref:Uncharacterized protein n=1 Tax=Aldrovandia affinis TaxID=143900 RepID=A0AAD7SS86_9TELE|nr:hypothetical protein AAFF_G00278160 [Aldrovandia affinis]